MADVSDPAIAQAYEDVRSNKSPLTWLLLRYAEDKKDKLELSQTGEGNAVDEIKPLLQPDQVVFAYAKITYAIDKESQREKFALFVYMYVYLHFSPQSAAKAAAAPHSGPQVKIMRRAKISVQKADVTKVLRTYSIEVPLETAEQLQEDAIITKLKAAGGANYGPGT